MISSAARYPPPKLVPMMYGEGSNELENEDNLADPEETDEYDDYDNKSNVPETWPQRQIELIKRLQKQNTEEKKEIEDLHESEKKIRQKFKQRMTERRAKIRGGEMTNVAPPKKSPATKDGGNTTPLPIPDNEEETEATKDKEPKEEKDKTSEEKLPKRLHPTKTKTTEKKTNSRNTKHVYNFKGSEKPSFARSKNEQADVEAKELDELLAFVENLDFEEYMEDLDIQESLLALKKRISTLKAQEQRTRTELKRAETALSSKRAEKQTSKKGDTKDGVQTASLAGLAGTVNASTVDLTHSPNESDHGVAGKTNTEDLRTSPAQGEEVQAAPSSCGASLQELRDGHATLRAKHSLKSLKQLIESRQAFQKLQKLLSKTHLRSLELPSEYEDFLKQELPDPCVATYDVHVIKSREPDPQNLPYLYRN